MEAGMESPDEGGAAQRARTTKRHRKTLFETSSDGARARSEGSLEPRPEAPCNKIEILRLNNDGYPHSDFGQLGFYLLAANSHIVLEPQSPNLSRRISNSLHGTTQPAGFTGSKVAG